MEQFDDNLLNYHYFMALFSKIVEAKGKEPREDWSGLWSLQLEKQEMWLNIVHKQLPHNRGHPFLNEIKFENIKKKKKLDLPCLCISILKIIYIYWETYYLLYF